MEGHSKLIGLVQEEEEEEEEEGRGRGVYGGGGEELMGAKGGWTINK